MVQQKHAHGRRRRARRTAATLAAVSFAAGCGAGDADEASVATSAPPSTMMGAATAPATSVEPSTTPPTSGPTTTAAAMTTVAAIDFTADAGGFIDLATTTERIAAGGGAVWTGNERSGLTKIDPVSMTATRHDGIALGEHFAYGFDSVWVASFEANLVYRVDPSTLEVVAEIPVPYNPKGMGVADDGIWVAQHRGGSASLIDPTTNEIDAVVPISRTGAHGPEFPVVLDGDVWVGALNAGAQARIDRATRNVTLIETPPHGPSGKAIGTTPAGVIVLDGGGAPGPIYTVIDPATNTSRIQGSPGTIGAGFVLDGQLWLAIESSSPTAGGMLVAVDPTTGANGRTVPLRSARPRGAVVAEGAVWIAGDNPSGVQRIPLATLAG